MGTFQFLNVAHKLKNSRYHKDQTEPPNFSREVTSIFYIFFRSRGQSCGTDAAKDSGNKVNL